MIASKNLLSFYAGYSASETALLGFNITKQIYLKSYVKIDKLTIYTILLGDITMCCIHSHNSWISTNILQVNTDKVGPATPTALKKAILNSSKENNWRISKALLCCSNLSTVIAIVTMVAATALAVLMIIGTVVATPLTITIVPVLIMATIVCIWLNRCQYKKYDTQMQAIATYCGQHIYISKPWAFSGNLDDMVSKCIQHLPPKFIDYLKTILGEDISKWPFIDQEPPLDTASAGIYLFSKDDHFRVLLIKQADDGGNITYRCPYVNGSPLINTPHPGTSITKQIENDIKSFNSYLPWPNKLS